MTYRQLSSVSKAAGRCGIPRSTLYRWIKRYELYGDKGLCDTSQKPKKLANLKLA